MKAKQKDELIRIGQQMSNWMYNMAQQGSLPEKMRREMKELQTQWDNIKHPRSAASDERKGA